MASTSPPGPLPLRWALILVTSVVAATITGGLTLIQTTSWPVTLLTALGTAGLSVRALHRVIGQ